MIPVQGRVSNDNLMTLEHINDNKPKYNGANLRATSSENQLTKNLDEAFQLCLYRYADFKVSSIY